MDTHHYYGFVVVDYLGRAYHPVLGGDIARYDPKTGKVELLKQFIDGKPPTPESRLALQSPDPLNWDITPDGKTLYCVPMSANHLFSYDLTGTGDTLQGRYLGPLVHGAKGVDCRAMCVGPKGDCWVAVTETGVPENINLLHLVRHGPTDKAPVDLGPVSVSNPDFTEFNDKTGKPLPFHGGFGKVADGTTTTKYVIMGVAEGHDGAVYILALHPYSVLQVRPPSK